MPKTIGETPCSTCLPTHFSADYRYLKIKIWVPVPPLATTVSFCRLQINLYIYYCIIFPISRALCRATLWATILGTSFHWLLLYIARQHKELYSRITQANVGLWVSTVYVYLCMCNVPWTGNKVIHIFKEVAQLLSQNLKSPFLTFFPILNRRQIK